MSLCESNRCRAKRLMSGKGNSRLRLRLKLVWIAVLSYILCAPERTQATRSRAEYTKGVKKTCEPWHTDIREDTQSHTFDDDGDTRTQVLDIYKGTYIPHIHIFLKIPHEHTILTQVHISNPLKTQPQTDTNAMHLFEQTKQRYLISKTQRGTFDWHRNPS